MYEIRASYQQPCAMRAPQRFAADESHEVITHIGVVPKVGNRGRVRRCIIHARQFELLSKLHPFIHFDLPRGIGKITEMHHCGTFADCPSQLVAGLNFNHLHAGSSELMVKRITMRLLNDDLRFHSGQVWQLLDEALVVASEDARESGLYCPSRT